MADVTTALTEEQIKDILNKINAATTTTTTTNTAAPVGAPNPTFNPLTTDFTRPVLQDGTALANKYGITADYDDIKKFMVMLLTHHMMHSVKCTTRVLPRIMKQYETMQLHCLIRCVKLMPVRLLQAQHEVLLQLSSYLHYLQQLSPVRKVR